MALPDLTGQNIQDTYQRVLQTDNGTLRDGTGSAIPHLTIDGTGSFGRVLCTTISASTGQFDANTIIVGNTSFSENNGKLEFKSGNNFQSIKTETIEFQPAGSPNPTIIISDDDQGYISLASVGGGSTVLRAEPTNVSSEYVMGSITQKGSGSFAILIDADGGLSDSDIDDAKFVIECNTAVPNLGTRLFSVSESMETRAYGHLKVDTNITASGNISASGDIYFSNINGGTF